MPGAGACGWGDEDISPVYAHTAQNASRQSLVSENLLVAFIEQIFYFEHRCEVPGDVVRGGGVDILIPGISCDAEGKVGILALADKAATDHQGPALGRHCNGKRARIPRAPDQWFTEAGVG